MIHTWEKSANVAQQSALGRVSLPLEAGLLRPCRGVPFFVGHIVSTCPITDHTGWEGRELSVVGG